ncbi:MAG: hypothetical protein WD894_09495 [Pirellulales bacterium]
MPHLFWRLLSTAILSATFTSCAESRTAQHTGGEKKRQPNRIADPDLENVYQVHPKVLSGGEPHGERGFAALERLGVKTVISVDGAKPDLDSAKRHGMRYVHLPHSYDGVPETRAKELAKAVRDLQGPVYIHCHHGKHRSPAAAAVACVGAGLIGAGDALAVLTAAGTSKNYRGLYKSAEQARRLDDALLDALDVEFRPAVEVPPLADAMVALERTHDYVRRIAAAGWRPVPEHPDLDPAHEALLLREHYTELLRTDELKRRPAEFQKQMRNGEQAAKSLEDTLASLKEQRYPTAKLNLHTMADGALTAINKNCAACHQKFRDVPLGEK